MILIDGHVSDGIAADDRGLMYGDGHFTTMRLCKAAPTLWSFHCQRLLHACERLQMEFPDLDQLYTEICFAANSFPDGVAKLILTRGSGGRGYSIPRSFTGRRILMLSHYPAHYSRWQQEGLTLGVCRGAMGGSPLLAGLKTLNRLEQVLLKAELDTSGYDEAVVLDVEGHIIEAVSCNLFWRRGADVYTPALVDIGVQGVMRQWCLDALNQLGIDVLKVQAPLAKLEQADEIWLTNALLGVAPVRLFQGHELGSMAFSRQLQERFCAQFP